jgi:hypothetical protein
MRTLGEWCDRQRDDPLGRSIKLRWGEDEDEQEDHEKFAYRV